MDALLKVALGQGLGYGLFVVLFGYVLKTNDDREKRYQNLLDKVTDQLRIVEIIETDVKEIKQKI